MASMRKAINDKCRECIYDPIAGKGTWRQQVEACTSRKCPLYPVRPVSTVSGAEVQDSGDLPPNEEAA